MDDDTTTAKASDDGWIQRPVLPGARDDAGLRRSGPCPLMMRSAADSCAIGVMAKAPQAGRSKTRLCPPLHPAEAAALSAAFLRDTTQNLADLSRNAPIAPYAAYAPAGVEEALATYVAAGTKLVLADGSAAAPEGVDGFGRCLLQAITGMLDRGHAAACVLSSDVPTLPSRLLAEAADRMLAPGDRAVLGASEDGGYYLLGLKAPQARMFSDIAWSTDSVAEATRARAREIGLDLIELDPWYDVDDAVSLATLLNDRTGYDARATRAVLSALGLDRRQPAWAGVPA